MLSKSQSCRAQIRWALITLFSLSTSPQSKIRSKYQGFQMWWILSRSQAQRPLRKRSRTCGLRNCIRMNPPISRSISMIRFWKSRRAQILIKNCSTWSSVEADSKKTLPSWTPVILFIKESRLMFLIPLRARLSRNLTWMTSRSKNLLWSKNPWSWTDKTKKSSNCLNHSLVKQLQSSTQVLPLRTSLCSSGWLPERTPKRLL